MKATYIRNEMPYKVAEYDGTPILLLGAYQVEWPDRFCVQIPHQSFAGTVGAEPLDLDDPDQRQIVLDRASEIRRRHFNHGRD